MSTKVTELQQILAAYTEYQIIAQQEQTKRREIDAWEKATIAEINAKRDVLMEYLDRSFDERAANFRVLFNIVDRAIESGNNEQVAFALHSITEIAKSSPFKELTNVAKVKNALNDPKYEWQL